MTPKIDGLTPAQEALLDVYADRWTKIGLLAAPADRARAERAVPLIYAAGDLPAPRNIRWVGSPMALGVAPSECIYGQHDAGFLSFYAFCREVLGLVEETEPLVGLMELAQSAGWALPLADECIISERPVAIHLNAAGDLHAIDRPALEYPDGEHVCAVNGVVVPNEWIRDRAKLDPSIALTHRNMDQRSAAGLIIGWARVLDLLEPRVIDTDPSHLDGASVYDFGQLLEVDLPDEPGQKFLKCRCGTGRTVVLRVDPTHTSARAANAASYGWDEQVDGPFRPEGRT